MEGNSLSCNTLESMLGTRKKIDFWSLDVEKHELEVLKTIDYETIEISVLLVEDFWHPVGQMDVFLLNGKTGFFKMSQLPIDSVYVHKNIIGDLIKNMNAYWYSNNWQQYIDQNQNYRKEMVRANVITC